jgi:hypothetical protein
MDMAPVGLEITTPVVIECTLYHGATATGAQGLGQNCSKFLFWFFVVLYTQVQKPLLQQ